MFKREHKERVAIAAVLATLSAAPIAVGLATAGPLMHFLWMSVGLLLWVAAIVLLWPGE